MRRVTIGDIADVVSGGTPSRNNNEYWGGHIPWIKTGAIHYNLIIEPDELITEEGLNNSSTRVIPKGTILMALIGQGKTRGQVAILGIDAAINQNAVALLLRENCSRDYVYQQLVFRYSSIRNMSNSSGQGNINADLVRSITFPFPEEPEQRQIGKLLACWDRGFSTLKSLIDLNSERKRGLKQQLLTGRKRFREFDGRPWRSLILGEIVTFEPRVKVKPKGAFLAAGIRSHGKGVFLKPDFDTEDIALSELFQIRTNDLVINITFAWEGAAAIVPPEADGALVSHRFPTFTFNQGVSFPEYFRHVIQEKHFVYEMGLASPGGAGRNRVLNKSDFLRISIKLPSIEEQQRIAAVLNGCDREIELLQKQLDLLKEQKRGLMQRLLTGEIRVKVPKEAQP
jgi:type I restriction enzyme, S subunit